MEQLLRLLTLQDSNTRVVLLGAMVLVGLMAVLVQVVVAYAAALASPEQRGQTVGTVTSGVVLGILLARFVSGAMADPHARSSAQGSLGAGGRWSCRRGCAAGACGKPHHRRPGAISCRGGGHGAGGRL